MAERYRASGRRHQEYIDGSAVRKTNQGQRPSVRRTPEIKQHPVVDYTTVRRNQEKALNMDLPYLLALTIAAICALCLCVNYLHVQSSITARIRHIEQLEKNVEVLRAQNDALETRINTSIDLDHVFKVATEELGMVYANKDQVIIYDKSESEYVRQYEDIPQY